MGSEQHYDTNKLHKIFFFACILLLSALSVMFANDYFREWKQYQEAFRTQEVEIARMKYDAASKALANDDVYQELLKDLQKASKEYDLKCAHLKKIEEDIKSLGAPDDIVNQQYRFSKAELDAMKYRLESARANHSPGEDLIESEYLALEEKVNQLKREGDEVFAKISSKEDLIAQCSAQLKEINKKKRAAEKKTNLIKRKLAKIDPIERSLVNQIASGVRNLPILDLANPTNKIDQIVLSDITEDVNFKQVPRVDRCTTCHLGIANPDFKEADNPLKTHPNLDEYLGKNSPHPVEEFGCTSCHQGRGRGTDFIRSAHMPSSKEQAKEWEDKYNWHQMPLWEQPMYPLKYAEAGCFKCHSNQTTVKGAEKLNLGLQIIERAGCYNCHDIKKYKNWPKVGPDLTKIASKTTPEWAYRWIDNPKSFKHDTWMPDFFGQSNNNDPDSKLRSEQEIRAMVHFLFENSDTFEMPPINNLGDSKNGEKLVKSIGCMACHNVKEGQRADGTTRAELRQQHGPGLEGLGSKTSPEWIYSWLKNPDSYHKQTRMPNMRLTDTEALDITTYLYESKNKDFSLSVIPSLNEAVLDEVVVSFLKKTNTQAQVDQKLPQMSKNEKLSFSGEKLIMQYGCYSCHNIKGFENLKPIGTDLTTEGSKSPHNLDFGFMHIKHINYAWFEQKLKDPRIFDEGKIKQAHEKLVMPNYNLSENEVEAVVTALLGFVKDNIVKNKMKPRTPENLTIEEGQKIVRQFNCQSCHKIEGDGGTIQASVSDWLVKYKDKTKTEADSVVGSFSPPNLIGEGKKVQTQWLFDFLHSPTQIRPWLKVKMPTYTFNASHLNVLTKYFSAIDKEEYPFTDNVDVSLSKKELVAAEKLFSKDYFGCAQCHIVGDKMPSGSAENWAPDFGLAQTRLKPEWIVDWIKNPNELLPGTKMPGYFDPQNFDVSGPDDIVGGDENEQIRILRNYLMTISQHTSKSKKKTSTVKQTPTPQAQPPAAAN